MEFLPNLSRSVESICNKSTICNCSTRAAREKGFALSRLGKGLAWADIAFSGTETVVHTVKAFNSSGETRTNAIFDAIGSAGSVIRSAGAIAGPTPLGFGLMAVGTAMGIV